MTFSATDPTGGAGLQADVLTLASIGCHPFSIATAVSVQDTIGVESLAAISAELVNDQARSILEDMEISVLEVAKIMINKIKKSTEYDTYIEYVEDRPFNDKRYYISNQKLKDLGWEITINLMEGLKKLI